MSSDGCCWSRRSGSGGYRHYVTLAGASDGQSLQVGSEVLRHYDMERHGRIEVREFGLPTGAHVREAVPMVDADGLTFGVLVRTDGRDVFVVQLGR